MEPTKNKKTKKKKQKQKKECREATSFEVHSGKKAM
jgi:hypothetical protein